MSERASNGDAAGQPRRSGRARAAHDAHADAPLLARDQSAARETPAPSRSRAGGWGRREPRKEASGHRPRRCRQTAAP